MKLKLWKITAMVTLPLVALIAVPTILTSCSNTQTPSKEDPTTNPNYAPNDAIKAKFSEAQFNTWTKGFNKAINEIGGSNIIVKLIGDIFETNVQIGAFNMIQKITLTPIDASDPVNVGKFKIIESANGTEGNPIYKNAEEITNKMLGAYNYGLDTPIETSVSYSPSTTIGSKFTERHLKQLARGFDKIMTATGATNFSAKLTNDILELNSQTKAILATQKIKLTPVDASDPINPGMFEIYGIADGETSPIQYKTLEALTTELKIYYDSGADAPVGPVVTYAPSSSMKNKFSEIDFRQVANGYIKETISMDPNATNIRVILNNDTFETEVYITNPEGTKTLNSVRVELIPVASGEHAGKFLLIIFTEGVKMPDIPMSREEIDMYFKNYYDNGASTQLATI